MPPMTISDSGWRRVSEFADRLILEDRVPSLAVVAGGRHRPWRSHFAGLPTEAGTASVGPDTIFLVASITKPLVAMAAMQQIERGRLTLGDRITDYLPEFGRHGKYGVEIRHLLTHTSGLPDMLPDNQELRQQNAPLSRFLQGVCECELSFAPGRGVQYQSMGFVVLAEIVSRLAGAPLPELLAEEFFIPLGMSATALGGPDAWWTGTPPVVDRIAEVRLPEAQVHGPDWNWNSRYWRQLGAPWGGLLTTAGDLAAYARMLLNGGVTPSGRRLLSQASLAAATTNQLACMKDVPEDERRCRPWGLGWRLHWPAHSANFGDLLGPRTFGHWGATGTVLWMDPDAEAFAVILSTQPQEPAGGQLARLSNLIAASWRQAD
ncbi:serine hydrolase domain-containing protein [Planctellipticum variicoloris]|uniref:serine hydrolase domain-containing protein n=1 Tax=Planctellipticum variicoloris TaxID=3064265 RepID=UPI0030133844|nr:beta-lactamase family protein [Planctomycetaceae bacterium SH412]